MIYAEVIQNAKTVREITHPIIAEIAEKFNKGLHDVFSDILKHHGVIYLPDLSTLLQEK
jgi:hypothetical protein